MGGRISLRDDFDAGTLRGLAKQSGDANQTRRLLALAPIYDGCKRLEAARIVEEGPIPAVHGVVRWRIKGLVAWLHEEFGVSVCEATLSGALKDMGFAKPR